MGDGLSKHLQVPFRVQGWIYTTRPERPSCVLERMLSLSKYQAELGFFESHPNILFRLEIERMDGKEDQK